MTRNGKLCKIYLKKIFFQNVLPFIGLFIDIIIYHLLRSHVMLCVYNMTICTEEATEDVLENFANFTVKPPLKQKPSTIELIVYKHSTHTRLCHLPHVRSEWKFSTPLGWLTSLSHSTWLIPETKRTHLIRVTNSWADAHKSWMVRCFLY